MEPQQPTSPAKKKAPAQPAAKRKEKVQFLPKFNVILLDDQEHTYQYVMEMLTAIFSLGAEKSYEFAREVDRSGRVIVCTTHRELAELKREQIRAYGCDPRLSSSRGSMGALIEPATV